MEEKKRVDTLIEGIGRAYDYLKEHTDVLDLNGNLIIEHTINKRKDSPSIGAYLAQREAIVEV